MPTSTVEDYLKAILTEERGTRGRRVSMGRIAAALELTPGTVTSMVKTLATSGLVDYEPYSGVELTESGRALAVRVLRRHRLIELFLVQVMGMGWSEVHPEAERLEHAMSDRLIERIDEMLGRPEVDPHGDPIPTAAGEGVERDLSSLARCPEGSRVTVERITDQRPEFLRLLEREGLVPGSRLAVVAHDADADTVAVHGESGRRFELGTQAATKILVDRDGG